MAHANARLTVHGRRLLVLRVLVGGRPAAHVARELGVSRQCAYRWIRRFRVEGEAGLHDRSSRPHHCPNRTPARLERRVLRLRRRERRGQDWLGAELGVPARTVGAILRRLHMPRLADCDPLTGEVIRASRTTTVRYERPVPGDLVHIDVKKLGRIPDGGGWRARGQSRENHISGSVKVGFDYLHAAVDDHSRLAYAEILPDEKGTTCADFLLRVNDFFASHRISIRQIISDNAKNYTRSRAFHAAVTAIGADHLTIRPHCPWQNGKVERLNRTLTTEWAYRQAFTTNTARHQALTPWLNHYNTRRRHTALAGHTPISRLSPT